MTNETTEKTIHVRLKGLALQKLEGMQKETGKTQSAIIRDLIARDTLIVHIDGKEVVKAVAEVQRDFNSYNHKMKMQLDFFQRTIQSCEVALHDRNINDDALKKALMNTSSLLDMMHMDYQRQRTLYDHRLNKLVD